MADDIEERKRAEETRSRLAAIVESSDDAIIEKTLDGVITSWNEAAERLYGYTAEEAVGKSISILLPPDRRDELTEILERVRRGERVRHYETRRARKDGKIIDVSLTVSPIRDSTDGIMGASTIAHDITESREAEERYRMMFENMGDAVAVYQTVDEGQDFIFKGFNRVAETIEKVKREDVIDRRVTQAFPGVKEFGILEVFRRVWRTGKPEHFPAGLYKDQRIVGWRENYVYRLPSGEVVAIYQDITERRQAEEKLRLQSEITENMFEGVVLTRVGDGAIVYTNRRAEEMFGVGSGELVGKKIATTVATSTDGRSPKSVVREITAILRERGSWSGEVRTVKKDGGLFWCRVGISMLQSSQYGAVSVAVHEDITERKRVEDELRGSEAKLKDAQSLGRIGSWEFDVESSKIAWSDQTYELYERDVALGPPTVEEEAAYYSPEQAAGLHEYARRAITEGIDFRYDLEVDLPSGRHAFYSGTMRPVKNADGRVVRLFGTVQDITERKRMQDELRRYSEHLGELVSERTVELEESERKYRSLVESIPDVPWTTDQKGGTTFISHNVTRVYGYTPEEIYEAGDTVWLGRIHPDDLPHVQEAFEALFTKNQMFDVEYRIQRKDGNWIWLHDRSVSTHEKGGVRYAYGVFSDITHRKRTEEQLRATRERLEYVVASNPAVIYTAKPLADLSDFRLTYVSDRVVSMLGCEPHEMVGHPDFWELHTPPEDARRVLSQMPRLWKEGQHTFEYRFLHRDGTYRWIREEAKVVRDADGNPVEVNGYWTDVTERRRLEEALARSQQLAAIGEMAAMVGHDLRNPLQGMTSTLYVAKQMFRSPKATERREAKKLLDTLDGEIQYMDKIVSDLQDYAAPLQPKLAHTNPDELLRNTMLSMSIAKNVKVRIIGKKNVQKVELDEFLLRRVLTNLITNAVQAMPKGGKLTLETSTTDNHLAISIRDTGVGIPRENLRRLFGPFFTTKAKGQGLGLAVCRRLVEAQGGSIEVESKVGRGSTFVVKLPLKRQK